MSPQLFRRQMDDGAWAITIGSVQQLQVARHYGFDRLVLANQLVGARAIRYVLEEINRDPAFDFYSLVDSVELVKQLAEAPRAVGLSRPLQLIVEGGFHRRAHRLPAARSGDGGGARRSREASPYLSLRGVGGYEGLLRAADPNELDELVNRFLDYLVEIAIACDREDLFGPGKVLLTAGGSTFYDLVAQRFQAAGIQRPFKVLTAQRLLSHPRLRRIYRSLRAASQAHALGGRSGSGACRRSRSVGLRPVAAGA